MRQDLKETKNRFNHMKMERLKGGNKTRRKEIMKGKVIV